MEVTTASVLTVSKEAIDSIGKNFGYSLTANEKDKVARKIKEQYPGSSVQIGLVNWIGDRIAEVRASLVTPPPGNTTLIKTVDPKSFKWYYHSSTKNETKEAIAVALDADRPILIMACKPSCDVCNLIWKDYLKATSKFATYLKTKQVVGLKIDDTSSHFTTLSKNKNNFTGLDSISGKKVNSTAPFFILFRPKWSIRDKTKINLTTSEVDLYISGFGSAKASGKSYDSVTAWLNNALGLDTYEQLA